MWTRVASWYRFGNPVSALINKAILVPEGLQVREKQLTAPGNGDSQRRDGPKPDVISNHPDIYAYTTWHLPLCLNVPEGKVLVVVEALFTDEEYFIAGVSIGDNWSLLLLDRWSDLL